MPHLAGLIIVGGLHELLFRIHHERATPCNRLMNGLAAEIEAPILHPELNVGVEWRFAYFRAHNAELFVNPATWIFWDLTRRRKTERQPDSGIHAWLTSTAGRAVPKRLSNRGSGGSSVKPNPSFHRTGHKRRFASLAPLGGVADGPEAVD